MTGRRRSFDLLQRIGRSARRSLPATVSVGAVAVAGLSTDTAGESGALAFEFGLAYLPHPDKLNKGGEDAHFYNHSLNAFGLADGVGAWSTIGIDPARFSRKLMRLSESALIEAAAAGDDAQTTPTQALRVAYDGVRQLGVQGSCTALIGILRHETLMLANLGDSGAMVLSPTPRSDDGGVGIDGFASLSLDRELIVQSKLARNGDSSDEDGAQPRRRSTRGYEIVYKTEDQLHRFNCPFQLGLESSDAPEAASISQHAVKVGDLVIAGSDGLWDNLFDSDVLRLADESDDVTELAFIIATAASRRASKTRGARATPFAVDASEAGIMFEGGKMDDITVIVGKIVRAGHQPPAVRARL